MSPVQFDLQRREIAGVDVRTLADRFGTPCYVYETNTIRERVADLSAFDVVRYAQKASSNIAILHLMRKLGVLVDSVSGGEIHRAFAAGYAAEGDPPQIVYTADIFDHETLDLVVEHGIHVNCGSPDMLEQLGRRQPGASITLRINPGFGHGHSRKTNTGGPQSKHGIWHDQVDDCLQIADRLDLIVTGLHMHIGSGTDLQHLADVCGALEATARNVGRSITSISAGGGLPTLYQDGDEYVDLEQYFQLWDATRQRLQNEFGHAVTLEIEPGRYLVAESGYLITEIRAVKQMGENLFYLLDAGFNNLARPILYGSYHPMSICSQQPSDKIQAVVVGGPLCESGDIFTQEEGGFVALRDLPVAQVGDLLIIERAGAYGFVMSSNYNSKPISAEVLVHEGQAHLIRRRQTIDDLLALESIPERFLT
jgi:diaminopimelate decarboxylase